ncbi:hypothetical protein [Sphingosinicella terrae]|uniref:hypothetical protein n=1 Tax=Sphingosinicella terrae TaxID=2172047 RepID=UPI000E0CDED0|nr:hypothetical protein [Sphingosinicella terrae]
MDSLITIVAAVKDSDVAALRLQIAALGNPAAPEVREALDRTDDDGAGTHFMSLSAIAAGEDEEAHLILEFTADGNEDRAIERIVSAIGPRLEPIFARARDWRNNVGLLAYLRAHRIGIGSGLLDNPGLAFAGTPAMTVGRIRAEAALAAFVAARIDSGVAGQRPIDRLAAVRRDVAADPAHRWALEPPPPPGRDERSISILSGIGLFAGPFVRTFLWPLGILIAAAFLIALLIEGEIGEALGAALCALGILVAATLLGLAFLYLKLRRLEESDWTDGRAAEAATLREIVSRENHCAQNHMISVTVRKPGPVRWLTIRLVFWLIGQLATKVYQPGFLGGISTIHAARWITVPGTRKLIFFSNFGGSWESYLEDFITRAHAGLTAVWSNSIGFPRARNLFQDGATDGERFKRYARASMVPTLFWYSAYPAQTTDHVRCNATLRRGLAAALTNDEAARWLALFGSASRPDAKLESFDIQSLVFGGLGFMPHGACLLYRLPDDPASARAFMAAIHPQIAFGDGRKLRRQAVLTVALAAGALRRLGLPDECVSGFPAAFLEGMSHPDRARILGDLGDNDPDTWSWGDARHDLALLAYGRTEQAIARLEAVITAHAARAGMGEPHRIPLARVEKPAVEPFGFVDGVSQPIIRGSYQSYRNNDPIHLVEPGEFLIGYPDNRGNFPPEPELSPLADPDNLLPVADRSRSFGNSVVESPRAIGRNGTFLVIRQLEQDVKGFWDYCWSESRRLQTRLPPPYDVRPDFIAAKLIGRWRDGSSLVRNPYYPLPKEIEKRAKEKAAEKPSAEAQPLAAEATSRTARPPTNPADQAAIPAATARNPRGDNDFLYGVEDPQALRCPFGAHIRRANPRDSLKPGSLEQVGISNRHRIYRLGRLYAPRPGEKPGLLFMCLNGDIERQFEFIQQTWLVSPAFHGLVGEQDPLNSHGDGASGYMVPSQDGPVRLKPLPKFVRTLGGGYFFMPSRTLLAFLGGL